MNIAVISGRFPITTFPSNINHKVYCDKHNLTYIHCSWPTKQRNKYYNKLEYILSYIDQYDYLFWIDDDAFFLDMGVDIRDYLPKGDSFISICKSPDFKSLKTYLSSGTFVLKCCEDAKSFLNQARLVDLREVKQWWKEELGFFSNGDQDAFIYLALEGGYEDKIDLHHYSAFNSRFENVERGERPFILHFTGPLERKHAHNKAAAEILDLDTSIVPDSDLRQYTGAKQPKVSRRKRISRQIRCLISRA
ncbi:galactosyl transferase GMA12/MNN10 family protein [Pseudovibrio axinellae]|uniref:Galactosyl transferase GMA12/MNN10 family protein n=1 Tax=Pseudovibrio axinellae TaxID=989403 RepID=A0A165W2D6_9HYPH|nr:hypothetical protein [Pseudovibrio axinellae]KZL15862.1 galactosyl transferase GMA12/MNN10 family protein [Pseudovibrio axinellae]SER82999.1 galactosyl transferase GMA12/MNN10 family protein [Pseudovibrio axinellae]